MAGVDYLELERLPAIRTFNVFSTVVVAFPTKIFWRGNLPSPSVASKSAQSALVVLVDVVAHLVPFLYGIIKSTFVDTTIVAHNPDKTKS
jgi:hypothetical protein